MPEKVEGEFSLWHKKVPKVGGKYGIDAGQYCKELFLECANSAFTPVAAMQIWQDKLEYAALASLSRIWRSIERLLAVRHNIMAL